MGDPMRCALCKSTLNVVLRPDRTGLVKALCDDCAKDESDAAQARMPRLLNALMTGSVERVLIGFSLLDLQQLIEQRASADLQLRLLRAMQLLDGELAATYAKAFNLHP